MLTTFRDSPIRAKDITDEYFGINSPNLTLLPTESHRPAYRSVIHMLQSILHPNVEGDTDLPSHSDIDTPMDREPTAHSATSETYSTSDTEHILRDLEAISSAEFNPDNYEFLALYPHDEDTHYSSPQSKYQKTDSSTQSSQESVPEVTLYTSGSDDSSETSSHTTDSKIHPTSTFFSITMYQESHVLLLFVLKFISTTLVATMRHQYHF